MAVLRLVTASSIAQYRWRKYVAPSPIEMKLSANKNIEQVCVVGNGMPQPIALITLSEIGLSKQKEDLIKSLEKITYPWSTEFSNPPKWMKSPLPWDWLTLLQKQQFKNR